MLSTVSPFAGQDLAMLLDRRATDRADHTFLVWTPFDGPSRSWSYRQFASDVARLAGGLAARGVTPGDRVMVQLENCPEALLMLFACARLGAVHVPINANARGPELAWFKELTQPVGMVTQPSLAAEALTHCAGLHWLAVTTSDAGAADEAVDVDAGLATTIPFESLFGDRTPARSPDPTADALIMFTSGTTSRPKGVVWTHANALWGARLGALQQGIRSDDVSLIFLPLYHVVGLSWTFLPVLWAGATVVLQPRFSASRYWPVAIEHGCTVGSQVIFTSQVLSRQPVPAGHRMRQWTDANSPAAHERHFGLRVIGAWGMTEMVGQGIVGDPSQAQRDGSIGKPSVAYEVSVIDDAGHAVAPGGSGHLVVKGVPGLSIFKEYYRDPAATASAFDAEGRFITGDRVVVHDDGHIQFAERTKDVIKVGGEGVSPAEIERVVQGVAGVKHAAVVAGRDAVYGEVPYAFIVVDEDSSMSPSLLCEAVLSQCRDSLARFKVPREVIVLKELPRINFGKIAKVQLRDWLRLRETASVEVNGE